MTSPRRVVRMLAAAGVVLSLGCAKIKSADHPLIRAYLAAEPVTPTWNTDMSPAEPMWNRTIEMGAVSVAVSARCCVGQEFVAQYSDESSPKVVFPSGDYVYPAELRIAPNGNVVYGRVSGAEAGIWQVTRVFAYDLGRRRLLEEERVDPSILPPVREPDSLRP